MLVDIQNRQKEERIPKEFSSHQNWDEGSESFVAGFKNFDPVIIYPSLVQRVYKKVDKTNTKTKKIRAKVKEKEEKIKIRQDIKRMGKKNRPLL